MLQSLISPPEATRFAQKVTRNQTPIHGTSELILTFPSNAMHGTWSRLTHQLIAHCAVYQVKICRQPECSCPDAAKGNVCKHHLFVMLRVLRLAQDNPVVWQKALLQSEVDEALGPEGATGESDEGASGGVMASPVLRAQYKRLTGGSPPGEEGGGAALDAAPSRQRPVEGDCPICYDEMKVCLVLQKQSGQAIFWFSLAFSISCGPVVDAFPLKMVN